MAYERIPHIINYFIARPMFRLNLSSNSESQDDNFDDGHFKKVTYQGHLSDSQHPESHSDSNSESSRRAGKLQGKITNNKSSMEKGKAIKKNCESAKMSRQRKKVYLELLEQKAEELKTQISNRKKNIRAMAEDIMDKFSTSNREKYDFLRQKIAVSKKLIAMAAEIQQLKKQLEDNGNLPQNPEQQKDVKVQSQKAIIMIDSLQQAKAKAKKKKEQQRSMIRRDLQQRIRDKQSCLQFAIKAYLYQFGVRGSFRTDVVQRSKSEWFQGMERLLPGNGHRLFGMRGLLQGLQQRSKKLDYLLRALKERVRQRFVVQFLLDRQFFIHNSAETIYKNSQLKNQ